MLFLPPRPSPGPIWRAGFLSPRPLLTSGTRWTCSWSEAGVRASSRCLSSAVSAIYRLWGRQLSPILSRCPVPYPILELPGEPGSSGDPLPCIDNPASPLHTRTLAHALQPRWPWLLLLLPSTITAQLSRNSRSPPHTTKPGCLSVCLSVCLSACQSCLCPRFSAPVCVSTTGDNTTHYRSHLNHEQTSDLDVSVQCPPPLGPQPWRRRRGR